MIKIRLTRKGVKNDPFYRIVAIEHHRKRDGKPLAYLGHWHPRKENLEIDTSEVKNWIKKGAKTSEKVAELLKKYEKTS